MPGPSRLAWCGLLLGLGTLAVAEQPPVLDPARILLWSLDLDERLQPWCPDHCIEEVPFTASYRHAGHALVFVGVHHFSTAPDATLQAIDSAFATGSPGIVILEGFPTAMGENPAPLVKQVATRGTASEDGYARSEGGYAASLALRDHVPFIGGEPTRAAERDALLARGFTAEEIGFAFTVRGLASAVHAGELDGGADPRLRSVWEREAAQILGAYELPQPSFAQFLARYRSTLGTDVTEDAHLRDRGEPGVDSPVARLLQADMNVRDQNLVAILSAQLRLGRRILVVYGGSHWTTLSAALQAALGAPKVRHSFGAVPQRG